MKILNKKNLLIMTACVFGLGLASSLAQLIPQKPKTPVQPEVTEPQCRKASGRIFSGVKIYRDSQCQDQLGVIYGIGRLPDGEKGVMIDYLDGSRNWKTRSAVTEQSYVWDNDPAISQKLIRELN